jgi:hypothetical protein
VDLIDFHDVRKNKKNIKNFQKIKWRQNSIWSPKIGFEGPCGAFMEVFLTQNGGL